MCYHIHIIISEVPLEVSGYKKYSKSPTYQQVLFWERICKSNLFVKSNKVRYPTNTISYILLYCNRFIILFTQIIHKKQTNAKNKENILNLTAQYLEKYSSTVQQLAYKGWHQVNRQEELLTGGGRGGWRW